MLSPIWHMLGRCKYISKGIGDGLKKQFDEHPGVIIICVEHSMKANVECSTQQSRAEHSTMAREHFMNVIGRCMPYLCYQSKSKPLSFDVQACNWHG